MIAIYGNVDMLILIGQGGSVLKENKKYETNYHGCKI
jgi:hypothetical protein